MRVHDRQWRLQFKSAPSAVAGLEKAMPWAVLALGTLAGLVLAFGLSGWWQSRFSWLQRIRSSTQARQESDARFHAMCEQAALGVVEVDLNTRGIISVNSHYCQLTRYTEQELLERNVLEMLAAEDRAEGAAMMDKLKQEQFQHAAEEFGLRAKDGSQLWVELNAFLSGPADARHMLVLVQDISGRKRLEQMERQGHQQLRNLMQRLPVGLVMEDHNGRFVYWNEEFLRLAGQAGLPDSSSALWWQRMYPDAAEHERVVQRWQNAQSKARAALRAEKSLLASLEGDAWGVQSGESGAYTIDAQEMQLVGSDGTRRPVLVSGVMQDDGCLMVLQDQTQRKAAEQEVKRLAFYDALTDLPNRRLMADRLQRAIDVSRRNLHFGGVALIDIDNFKAFNEAYGLDQGDQLLVGMSKRIKDLLPAGMTLARQSGDDFVLLLEDLGPDSVIAAGRLAQEAANWMRVLREPIEVAGTPRQITVSMDLSLFGGQVMTVEEVLRRAEMAMYQAKSQGRNASCFYDPQLQSALQERRALELDMRHGLDAGEFELFYQPQVEMGRVIGAEALLRWKHPSRGYVPPVQFIPLAEETGFILPLGEWVLQAACHQLSCWAKHPRYGQLVLSVNVSPSQFLQPGFVDQVLKALAEHGADASKLKLELTEGMLVTDVDDTIAKMARLKSYGIGFSLDDFGTGYSSLAYLKRLPLDQLKIDRSFVRDVLTDPNDAAIARTIVALAKSLGLHVIAEGVETLAQCRFLEGIRCYAWQGYLMSPAVPPLEFERLVTHGSVPGSGAPALSPASMR
nr:GGDEF domain-containing phosphodiesterase [Comamonas testosteroni]